MIFTFIRKIVLVFIILFSVASIAQNKRFKVVIDAGHGGKDGGTVHNSYKEKAIVLKVALKIGKLLEKEGYNVVYTRKTDVFIELRERANIANRADADLFVSIHCNGVKNNAPYGTETFVMGLSRSGTNLEIARKENNVITLEKDYKVKYKGFNPNSPTTSIGINLAQEESRKQSIILAGKIHNGFKTGLKKFDRGVKQIPLWVLDATVMPGALIELGFLSNPKEGKYLNSDAGQSEMAQSIAKAIISYKKQSFTGYSGGETKAAKEDKIADDKTELKTTTSKAKGNVLYKVQIATSKKNLDTKPSNFKKLNDISKIKSGSVIKYYYGETVEYTKAKKLLIQAKEKGYASAFIVAFRGNKIITIKEALE